MIYQLFSGARHKLCGNIIQHPAQKRQHFIAEFGEEGVYIEKLPDGIYLPETLRIFKIKP